MIARGSGRVIANGVATTFIYTPGTAERLDDPTPAGSADDRAGAPHE
jgi:hypothetical protein